MTLIRRWQSFSALQRAENSSNQVRADERYTLEDVSVLFSEPKIPQTARSLAHTAARTVSVLFSEPKIPQRPSARLTLTVVYGFSALQRAENSSNRSCGSRNCRKRRFQCSSASRKFLKSDPSLSRLLTSTVSVLFSEPKIPQKRPTDAERSRFEQFQCSSASRKFLKQSRRTVG